MLNIIIVGAGIIIFIYSMTLFWRTYRILEKEKISLLWIILTFLVIFFLLGYVAFEYLMITGEEILSFNTLVSQIFFWGAVFVLICAKLFHSTFIVRKQMEETLLISNKQLQQEIIERKQTEKALEDSLMLIGQAKREWESSVDSIPQLICLIDSYGHVLRTNRVVEQWNLGQVVNVKFKGLHELLHPVCADSTCYWERFWSWAWEELKYGRPTECEVNDRVIGRYLRVQVRATLPGVCRKDEETASYAVVVVSDITERKLAEEKLQAEKERFRLAAQSLSDVVYEWDMGGNVQWFGNIDELLGYAPGEFPRTLEAWMDILHPEDQDRVWTAVERHLRGEAAYEIEYRVRHNDGAWRHWLARGSVLRDTSGKPYRWVGAVTDITERKRAEDEIRKLNEELEQRVIERTAQLEAANKELEAFSYSVSHDLRAPLRAIDGFSQILFEGYLDKLDDEGKRLLNVIRGNTHKMAGLIDDLLALSRIGRKEIELSEIDINKLVKTVLDEIRTTIHERELQFNTKPLPPAHGDQGLIRQVFFNLMANAVKFTRPKETAIIEVGGYGDGSENVYYVKDNGAGFDMGHADKLFGAFHRLHSGEEFEGTGIGLAIVQRIIHRHGGQVWAQGKVNEGATFYFSLSKKEGPL